MDVSTPVHEHRLQQVTWSISLTLTGTAWQLKLLITIISEKMKNTSGLYPHASMARTPFSHHFFFLAEMQFSTVNQTIVFPLFGSAWLYRTSFIAKGRIVWHENEVLGGIQLNWNANWFSLLNNWNATEISLGAISHLVQSYITA